MEKPQFVIIGILAVAIGFFALRFTSDDVDEYGPGGDRYAMADGGDYGDYGDGSSGSGRLGRGNDPSGGGSRGSIGDRSSRLGPGGTRGGTGGSGSGRGGTETVAGGARGRGGRIGTGVGSRRGGSGRPESSSISGAGQRKRASLGGGSRNDRADVLTAKSGGVDPFYDEGNDLDDDPSDDVVLEVTSKDDVDRKADVLEGVEEGDDDYWLEVGEDSRTTFPDLGNANPNAGTITLDVKPNWNGADVTDNSLLQIREPHVWENRMQLVKNGQFLRFIVTDNTGHEADISYKIANWQEGDAHNVTATWEDGTTVLYIDGKQVGTNSYPGKLEFKPTTPMYFGSDHASGGSYGGADSQIGGFQVLDKARSPSDIVG